MKKNNLFEKSYIIASEKGYWNTDEKNWVEEKETATQFPNNNFKLSLTDVNNAHWEEY